MEITIAEGIRLFNTQRFFEAHEALEAVWLKTEGEEKIFLHGLIQVAAAFHHFICGNPVGFQSLLEKGLRKLEQCGESHGGIELAGFVEQLQPWRQIAQQFVEQHRSKGSPGNTSPTPAHFPHIPLAAKH